MREKQFNGRKAVRKTLLVVGEGDTEEAFLKYLRSLYCCDGRGVTVTVRNAHGKGPEHVIDHTIRQTKMYQYGLCIAFLDTDIVWSARLLKRARQYKVTMVGSTPCFEGLLLSILGMKVPELSLECKKEIQRLLAIDLTDRHAYATHFPQEVLQCARGHLTELDKLLRFFQGSWTEVDESKPSANINSRAASLW